MYSFTEVQLSRKSYWRPVILFGRNVASNKFGLGKALLELVPTEQVLYLRSCIWVMQKSDRKTASQLEQFVIDVASTFHEDSRA